MERARPSFFCHQCNRTVDRVTEEFACGRCNSGFVEEVSASDRESLQSPHLHSSSLFEHLFDGGSPFVVRELHVGGPGGGPGGAPGGLSGVPSDGAAATGAPFLVSHPGHHFLQEIINNIMGLQQFNPGEGIPPGVMLYGNPGDYAWGRGGLDAIITNLLNQMEGAGPPPMNQDAIQKIPVVKINQKQVDAKTQCAVCWEDYTLGESVRQLNCDHCYHEGCIVPWLELHGTCPVCRQTQEDPEQKQSQQSQAPPSVFSLLGIPPGSSSSSSSSNSSQQSEETSQTSASNPETQSEASQQRTSARQEFEDFDLE